MSIGDCLLFYVNGKRIDETRPNPEHTLLYYLRNVLGMKGTKMACGEGGCGACTVMVSRYDREYNKVMHMSIYACITPVCRVHGMAVTTVEGVGSIRTRLHPVQERIAKFHGSQCGFCTPGIVMSMYTLLKNFPEPSQRQIEDAFDGNLCRCTGYRPILDGFKTFSCPKGENCCRVKKEGGMIETKGGMGEIEGLFPLDPTQDLIFPPELMLISSEKMLVFVGERVTWYRPANLTEVLQLKQKHTDVKLVVGSTEVSVELRFKDAHYPIVMCPSEIPEMNRITILENGMLVGAAVPLSEVFDKCQECVDTRPTHETQVLSAIIDMLRKYGGQQIRNLACIGGNLITASPIADMNPILLAAKCQLNIASADKGERVLPLDQSFFPGYRRVAIKPGEVLISVLIPWMSKNEYFNAYKQARRRDDDISIVSSACWLKVRNYNTSKYYIEDCRLVFGGMAPITKLADKTSTSLIGCEWNRHVLERGLELLKNELSLPLNVPGGMPEYREVLAASFFFKFYLYVTQLLTHNLQPEYISGMNGVSLPLTESTQAYEEVPGDQKQYDPVGRPIVFQSAYQQATGEAKYVDDMPTLTGELYAAPVLSSRAHARILSIDVEDTLSIPGVHYVITHKDIPAGGSNDNGLFSDEELFAESEVMCYGQLIGLVIAEDPLIARRAARTVRISYENLPAVVTIEEAIKSNSFIDFTHTITRGDSSVISDCETVDHGEIRIGGQEHFYFEPNGCIVIPTEDGGIEMISSTQALTTCQLLTAQALGIQANKIVCKIKRIGGGFGGKETRSCVISAAVAVAANKLLRPIRCVFDRDDDMKHTGGRHPFLAKYKVGYQSDGKIIALIIDLYSNAGISSDLSPGVMDRALFHIDNAYNIPNILVNGHLCRTNLPSNTAFRGFGGPQGMFVIESIISDIALSLEMPPNEVRWNNMYVEGNTTPYGMPIVSCQMQRCWQELLEKSNYSKLVEETTAFNKQNKFIKRGVSVIPTKFGISFGIAFLNQGGKICIYHFLIYISGPFIIISSFHNTNENNYFICIQSIPLNIALTLV
ncbi:Xanthine dehydrogenase/oxidase [Oopsacas minuta]|uniref:xanthine dehydrogenase n=1 Tax=Oopsacas minuta TaxID=111878 RepID=A0AAV7K0X6_9METZ|nr:Xanthine dehydrogenase/oxidase [Oopsacas minuta]